MHIRKDGLILKGKDKRLDPSNEVDRKKDAKMNKSLALKVPQSQILK